MVIVQGVIPLELASTRRMHHAVAPAASAGRGAAPGATSCPRMARRHAQAAQRRGLLRRARGRRSPGRWTAWVLPSGAAAIRGPAARSRPKGPMPAPWRVNSSASHPAAGFPTFARSWPRSAHHRSSAAHPTAAHPASRQCDARQSAATCSWCSHPRSTPPRVLLAFSTRQHDPCPQCQSPGRVPTDRNEVSSARAACVRSMQTA